MFENSFLYTAYADDQRTTEDDQLLFIFYRFKTKSI